MPIALALLSTMALLAPGCGPGHDDGGDADADADADADGDSDGDGDAEVDCGGTDTLDVQVVEDHVHFADAVPKVGALVVVDCAAGRLRVTTDEAGMAHFSGLDFANDPPDVSAVVAGQAMKTRPALGHAGEEVPQPFVFDFPAGYHTAEHVRGDIVRTSDANEVYCWCDGSAPWPRQHIGLPGQEDGLLHHDPRYDVSLFPELTPARAACLEYGEGDAGPRTLLAFGEVTVEGPGEGPPMVLRALDPDTEIERLDVSVRHIGGDQDPYLGDRDIHAFIDDQDSDGYGVAIGIDESSTRQGDLETLHVAWVPGAARQSPCLTLSMDVDGGTHGWGIMNIPVSELAAEPYTVRPPPGVEIVQDDAGRTMRMLDSDWADDAVVIMSRGGSEYWRVTVPGGLGDWQMPEPPDDQPFASNPGFFVGAYGYDVPPPADNMIADWSSQHVRAIAAGQVP